MEDSNNQSQYRFLLAAVMSILVLFGWSYFFAPTRPVDNANTQANTNTATTSQPAPVQPAPNAQPVQPAPPIAPAADAVPNRSITIKSPLYEVTLDSRGAVATSWIILKNKGPRGDFAVYADGSTEGNRQPLQLISQVGLAKAPRELPFLLTTRDQNVTNLINERNYQISIPDQEIVLAAGQERQIEFTLTDASGTEVKKSFVFRADTYVADLALTLRQNGQPVPDTKLVIGPSIGDHAINFHTLYRIEPEAVAAIDGDIVRRQGYYSFTFGADNQAKLADNGLVNWAGVADAYFSMVAVPSAQVQGVTYQASRYDVQIQPVYDSIFNWVLRSPKTSETRHLVTAYVPIATDGSVTKIYTGTNDYFLLEQVGESLSSAVGRPIDLTNIINFSNYWWLRWIQWFAIPLLYALNFINGITLNYGLAIIVLTFLFYSLLFPLRWKQSKSFKKASAKAPKMKEIQDKIKDLQKKGVPMDDPRMRTLQMDQLRMTKDALPLGGCLPMLLQFPLLLAFFTAVTVSLEVRQASFLWLPDLSAGD
ncbi:MAG: membrane protein insertase YidC, partial [Acidobacteria bacterium]|nr:membrane protein insertase YidC [Acidobacteriota bacterium]MCA1608676.1 membrane protein insertase YidC [Acidobacteriota bacterium]